jgi:hypothetical protein
MRVRTTTLRLLPLASVLLLTAPHDRGAHSTANAASQGSNVEAVWAREEQYWRYLKAGDVESYLTLWRDGFRGWPCGQPHTTTKDSVGTSVRGIRDQKIRLTYALTREGAADFGDVVVIYYQVAQRREFPDGHVTGSGRRSKLTHTWRRFGDTWQIIGGMCAVLEQPATP